jgi:hypothetical protein
VNFNLPGMKIKDPVVCSMYDSKVRTINSPGIFMNIHEQYDDLSSETEPGESNQDIIPKKKGTFKFLMYFIKLISKFNLNFSSFPTSKKSKWRSNYKKN